MNRTNDFKWQSNCPFPHDNRTPCRTENNWPAAPITAPQATAEALLALVEAWSVTGHGPPTGPAAHRVTRRVGGLSGVCRRRVVLGGMIAYPGDIAHQ